MSGLQKLVNCLVAVIDGYFQIKIQKIASVDELKSIEPLLDKTPEELMISINTMIETVKKDSPTRAQFLEYLAYLIKTIKVCTNNEAPLTSQEEIYVKETLSTLILSMQNLRVLSPRNTYLIKYDGKEFHAPGFAGYATYAQCLTGVLLQKLLPIPGLALTTTEFTVKDIERYISDLIKEHQEFCRLKSERTQLIQQNAELTKQNDHLTQQLLEGKTKLAKSVSEVRLSYSPGFYQPHFDSQPNLVGLLPRLSTKSSPTQPRQESFLDSGRPATAQFTLGGTPSDID